MKILIVGSTGMLGGTLKKYLYELKLNFDTLDRKDLDFSYCSYENLYDVIKNKNCNILINCAGLIKQRKNIETADFISVNSLLPHRLSKISKELSLKFIHITTDCVFDGKIGNYDENSKFDLVDTYGLSKIMGEPSEYSTIIRTSIIGEESKNKLSLLEWVKSNKDSEINGFTNHYWNGVTCLQLSKVIHQIISENIFWNGVRHIYSNRVSKYDLVKMINEIYELNIKINSVESELIDRSLSSIYNIDYLNIPNIYEQIKDTKNFHNEIS